MKALRKSTISILLAMMLIFCLLPSSALASVEDTGEVSAVRESSAGDETEGDETEGDETEGDETSGSGANGSGPLMAGASGDLSLLAAEPVKLGDFTLARVDGEELALNTDYTYNDTTCVLTITGSAGYIIGMSGTAPDDPGDPAKKLTTTHSIVIAADVTVTLDSVRIDRSGPDNVNSAAFAINADKTANVLLKDSSFLKSGAKRSGLEVGARATVIINDSPDDTATGELTAQSSAVLVQNDPNNPEHYESEGAGIGGAASPTIIINDGIIDACSTTRGSGRGAGIGGSSGGTNPQVIINSGIITAMSCRDDGLELSWSWNGHGAGIGTGHQGTVSADGPTTVTITGGDVTAYSTTSEKTGEGAGIGAGHYSTGVKVNIEGGTVKAGSIEKGAAAAGAGIGGGARDNPGALPSDVVVTISGGDVTAYANEGGGATGAGIGSGINGGATVNITGGTINACSSGVGVGAGAGIGSGSSNGAGSTSSVNISGGTISAYSGQKGTGEGAGIGKGSADTSTSTVIITGGSIVAKKTEGGDVSVTNPTDGAGHNVWLTTITLEGVNAPTLATSSILPGGANSSYGLKDVYTDNAGKLFFWLPVGTYTDDTSVISVGVPAVNYPGEIVVEEGNGNEVTLMASWSLRTLIDAATGVSVSAYSAPDATLSVIPNHLHQAAECAACKAIQAERDAGKVLVLYDIAIEGGYEGPVTVTIPVGVAYEGQTLTLLHCSDGVLDTRRIPVSNGVMSGNFTTLSPFAVLKADSTGAAPGGSSPGGASPATGDAAPLTLLFIALVAAGITLAAAGFFRKRYAP